MHSKEKTGKGMNNIRMTILKVKPSIDLKKAYRNAQEIRALGS
jgi:hypothetical protein